MINSVNQIQRIKTPLQNLKDNKTNPNNIMIDKVPFIINKNKSISNNNNNQRLLINSTKIRKLENKSIEVNLNQINSMQKNVFLHLNDNINNGIFSPRINRQKKFMIRNKSSNLENNILPKLNLLNKNKDKYRFLYIGGDFSFRNNKYYSDLIDDKNKSKEGMETADIKIEQLAKDLHLFHNKNKNNNLKLNFDSLNKNKLSDDEYNNILPIINSDNSSIINSNSQSRISSGIPRFRLYSGKFTSNSEIYGNNRYLNKQKLKRLYSPSLLFDRFNIEGTNVMSPLCEKAREIFLYKKIFYYFGGKKFQKVMKKLNIIYAMPKMKNNLKKN